MPVVVSSLSDLLSLKENISEDDYEKLKRMVEEFNCKDDLRFKKFIVCLPNSVIFELNKSLGVVDFRSIDHNSIRDEYKKCFTYLVIVNDSIMYKNLHENHYDKILNIKVGD